MIVKNRKGVAARLAASVLSWSCTPKERRMLPLKVASKVVDTNAGICSITRPFNPCSLHHHQVTPPDIRVIKASRDFKRAVGVHDAKVLCGDECA